MDITIEQGQEVIKILKEEKLKAFTSHKFIRCKN